MATGVYREAVSKKIKGRMLDHMRLSRGEDGGHVVEHHYAENGLAYHKPTTHVFGEDEGKELIAHLAKHAKINTGDQEEAVEGE
jgi:hypothetical protein